jgi:aspartyl-tRNA(Asn)/glutamyl-tRNA(Gln) amidotransferase subunit A
LADLTSLSAAELAALLRKQEISSVELTAAYLERIAEFNPELNSFLIVTREAALAAARRADEQIAAGESPSPLTGVPIAVKDNLTTTDAVTTAGSRILEGYLPPYDATVVKKLRAAGMPILGKTNLDEFAMGSSTEWSAYGPSKNPWDLKRTPGGSGGGSSSAVAARIAPLALGSDTGGSIRFPAAVTGSVGAKPTYGAVSRYGLIALASSLDQVGPVANTVLDAALLQDVISGHDPLDSPSIADSLGSMADAVRSANPEGLRIGVIKQLMGDGFQPEVRAAFEDSVARLTAMGASVVEVDCPSFEYAPTTSFCQRRPPPILQGLIRFAMDCG